MAIKFSAKDQPAASAVAKPVKPAAAPKAAPVEAATDLFKSPVETPPRKAGRKK
ncbi:hypothetical protein [Mesorhizobium sp. B2-3-5]|uniref:hypothetical protein n=1 Tax=Mesorhizobium sp. B2-3-5 TaxID=2589958 RepID=UPI0015E33C62|nr:hypothetical protein [Mesorhizobium sp. B2-3-5]